MDLGCFVDYDKETVDILVVLSLFYIKFYLVAAVADFMNTFNRNCVPIAAQFDAICNHGKCLFVCLKHRIV